MAGQVPEMRERPWRNGFGWDEDKPDGARFNRRFGKPVRYCGMFPHCDQSLGEAVTIREQRSGLNRRAQRAALGIKGHDLTFRPVR